MAIKIEQGATISLTDAIKIATGFNSYGDNCYVGQTIYHASAYDYPNTNQITTKNTFYAGNVDAVDIDVFSQSELGHNGGYSIPFQGYYCFESTINLFECPFAEHYRAIIRRYNGAGSVIKDYPIGCMIAPVSFWADGNGIQDLPLTATGFHTDNLNGGDTLLVLVKRSDWFIDQYYTSQGTNFEYEANNNTKASFSFSMRVSIINPRPA